MIVAVYARKIVKRETEFYEAFFKESLKLGWHLVIEKNFFEHLSSEINLKVETQIFETYKDLGSNIDLMISIGGDGTFLECVNFIRDSGIPILGINTGRLGFLADTKTINLKDTLDNINHKKYVYQKRSLLAVKTEDKVFEGANFAVNEVAIHRKDKASMITVEAYLNDVYLNSYWADGLLVGTPTGSTAYNLSCGGPIISPGSNVHFLTPISAHNLNVRPIIVPEDLKVTLKGRGRDDEILLSLDSRTEAVRGDSIIEIRKADFMINLIKFEENDFFKTIREKMMWGIDLRNE